MFTQTITINAEQEAWLDTFMKYVQDIPEFPGVSVNIGPRAEALPIGAQDGNWRTEAYRNAAAEAGVGAHRRVERRFATREAADRLAGQLKKGDKVRLTEPLRPKYLVGKVVTVVRVNQATVTIVCGNDCGRFAGQEVRCPANCIEKV